MKNSYYPQMFIFYMPIESSHSIFAQNKSPFSFHNFYKQCILVSSLLLQISFLYFLNLYFYQHLLSIESWIYFHKQILEFIINITINHLILKYIYINMIFFFSFSFIATLKLFLKTNSLNLSQDIINFMTIASNL